MVENAQNQSEENPSQPEAGPPSAEGQIRPCAIPKEFLRDGGKEFFTLQELMRYLDISRWTIYRMIEKGYLPAVKISGQWRFRIQDVQEYISKKLIRYGTESQQNYFFRLEVLDQYKHNKDYYLQDEAFYGRVGNKEHHRLFSAYRSLSYLNSGGAKRLPEKGIFYELLYWKIKQKDGQIIIVVDQKAFDNLPDNEKSHWEQYMQNQQSNQRG
jgi:excisionase family DNA binding protein